MEYNPFQQQDQTKSEAMHAQECTHMNLTNAGILWNT